MRLLAFFLSTGLVFSQGPLTTRDQVLERYKQAIGGVDTIRRVQSETQRGQIEGSGLNGQAKFVNYAKPFKAVQNLTLPDGTEVGGGFNGAVSWQIRSGKASIDRDTPVESDRRDADLQYVLHQPDYFQKFEFSGVRDFEGRPCYWLHGITHWGKDNNQFYDVETGLLSGYRFQADQSDSKKIVVLVFSDYKSFGGPKVATKQVVRSGDFSRTTMLKSVSYEPLDDSIFELPAPVKVLLKCKHHMNTTWRATAGRRYWRHVEDTSGTARLLAAARCETTTERDIGASLLSAARDQ
jgi:hypothetical protein